MAHPLSFGNLPGHSAVANDSGAFEAFAVDLRHSRYATTAPVTYTFLPLPLHDGA
jgi:hypothetical protein